MYAALEFERSPAGEKRAGGKVSKRVAAEGTAPKTEAQMTSGQFEDLQSALRFPLHLAASVKTEGNALYGGNGKHLS